MKKKALESQKQLRMDYHATFATEAGIRVLEDIKKMANYEIALAPIDGHGRFDSYLLAERTGERNLCSRILQKLKKQG